MIQRFRAIARNTFTEVTRQPVYGLIVLATLGALGASPFLTMFSLGREASLLKDFGVSTLFLAGLLLVAIGASTVVGQEVERHTVSMLLSKPVGRGLFLAAKLAGVLMALAMAMFLFTLALLLVARQGPPARRGEPLDLPVVLGGGGALLAALLAAGVAAVALRKPFWSAAVKAGCWTFGGALLLAACFSKDWQPQPLGAGFDPLLAKAALLSLLGDFLLGAVAILLSISFRRGALFGTLLVFLAGLLLAGESPWLFFLPDLELFWVGEVFYEVEGALPASYLAQAGLYSAAYSLALWILGVWVLERREVG